jgi:hypothetical protein
MTCTNFQTHGLCCAATALVKPRTKPGRANSHAIAQVTLPLPERVSPL